MTAIDENFARTVHYAVYRRILVDIFCLILHMLIII